jgi:putative salt-induced outer membrane protein
MPRSPLILLLFVLLTAPSFAQNPPPDPLTGAAAFGYLATSGNTDSTNANGTFDLTYERTRWTHELALAAVAATSNEVTNAEAYSAKYKAQRPFGEDRRSYLFTTVDWRKDRFSAYERELSEAVGYGRRLVERGPHTLKAEIGAGARQAFLIDGTEEADAIVRAAMGYEWMFTDMTGFTQDLVVESGETNTSIQSVSALRARLVGNIGLVLSYRIKDNSDVVLGTEPTDRFTSIALEYAF